MEWCVPSNCSKAQMGSSQKTYFHIVPHEAVFRVLANHMISGVNPANS